MRESYKTSAEKSVSEKKLIYSIHESVGLSLPWNGNDLPIFIFLQDFEKFPKVIRSVPDLGFVGR